VFLLPRIVSIKDISETVFEVSSFDISSKAPSLLAISPDESGSPSFTVTIPTTSIAFPVSSCFGSIKTTSSCAGFNPKASGVNDPPRFAASSLISGATDDP